MASLFFAPTDGMTQAPLLPLTVAGLSLRLGGEPILRELDFELASGGVTALIGPNGAGKTVLLRMLHGLLAPDSGRVRWNGRSPAQASRMLGMVFQQPVMLRRSVAANIDFALRARGVARGERADRRRAALALTGLTEFAGRAARGLSGGERQRLAIARAWAPAPAVLFLDEPTANLDPRGTRDIEALIHRLREQGTRVLLTTHDLGQAARLADDVLFLARGRLCEHRAAADFFGAHGPKSAEARAFLSGQIID